MIGFEIEAPDNSPITDNRTVESGEMYSFLTYFFHGKYTYIQSGPIKAAMFEISDLTM